MASYNNGSRYVLAFVDFIITLVSWRAHQCTQPYAYRFQNSIESFLYVATLLFLALMMVYSALPNEHAMTGHAVELISTMGIFGSLFGAAAFLIWRLRATQKDLKSIDFSEALAVAEAQLDASIRERLADGTIRLLKCDWLASAEADSMLGRDPVSGKPIVRRRQEMPEAAFFSPVEAAETLFQRGDRSILALSYRWQTRGHPDPKGTALDAVRRFLRGGKAQGCGLFWDFASLPQPGAHGLSRTADEDAMFSNGLQVMGLFYSSLTRTAVLQLKDVPPCPAEFVGKVTLFGLGEKSASDSLLRDALKQDLSRFGRVNDVTAAHTKGSAYVRFATQEQAQACISGLRGDRGEKRTAESFYNTTAYDRDGGRPYSGWCTFEQSVSMMAAAHLARAEQRSAESGHPSLSDRFARAQASRAKLVDLSGGTLCERKIVESPEAILRAAIDAVGHAKFMERESTTRCSECCMSWSG